MIKLRKLKKLIIKKKSCFAVANLHIGIKTIVDIKFCGDLSVADESWLRNNLDTLFTKKKSALRFIEKVEDANSKD